jgi:hypothetical protein
MPAEKIAPSAQLRQSPTASDPGSTADALSTGIETDEAPTSALLTLASRLVLQEALGRDRYQRGSPGSHRNGYRPGRLEGAEGRTPIAVPQAGDALASEAGQQLGGDAHPLPAEISAGHAVLRGGPGGQPGASAGAPGAP